MDEIEIVGFRDTMKSVVTDIEMHRQLLEVARAGDSVGLLLRGVRREDVERGQVIAAPGTIQPHRKFRTEVYILSKEEGGRHTPFYDDYCPQFFFDTTDVTGSITLPEGVEMVLPGDTLEMEVELGKPVALEARMDLAIREGGRTVGAGRIVSVGIDE